MDFAAVQPDDREATDDLQDLARRSLASCHADLLTARLSVLSTRDPAGIHGVRVALRRLRAALKLFETALPRDIAPALRRDAKQLADNCGPTRDLDVFLAGTMAELESFLADRSDMSAELRALRAAALRLRRARHDAVRDVLQGEVFAVFEVRLGELLAGATRRVPGGTETGPSPTPAAFAHHALQRRHRKLRRSLKRLGDLDANQRHAVRLQVKRQRYAATFLADLFDPKAANAYIRSATNLQEALGLANDRVVAARIVADIRSSARTAGRLDWITGVLDGVLAARTQQHAGGDRCVRRAARRFVKAARFWRRGRRDGDGETE